MLYCPSLNQKLAIYAGLFLTSCADVGPDATVVRLVCPAKDTIRVDFHQGTSVDARTKVAVTTTPIDFLGNPVRGAAVQWENSNPTAVLVVPFTSERYCRFAPSGGLCSSQLTPEKERELTRSADLVPLTEGSTTVTAISGTAQCQFIAQARPLP
jgi:hypothetical protein